MLWRITLLGGLSLIRGDRVLIRFRTQKTALLLAYLAHYRHRIHRRDELIELLWPDSSPEGGRDSLSVALSSLRRQLEPPGVPHGAVLLADRVSVGLSPATVTTDVAAFEAALRAVGVAPGSTERIQRLQEAVELYQGELLPGFLEDWVLLERARLAEAFHQALEQLIAHEQQAGDLPGALQWARRAVSADLLREEAHRELIRLLAAAGQPDAALRQYRELERLLKEKLEAEPEAATQTLARDIEHGAVGRQPPAASRSSPNARPATVDHASPPVALASHAVLPTGTVTFLLTDIEGSTALWERTGDAFASMLASHHGLLRSLIREHGGYEVKETGDGFLVAFRQAGDALSCAIASQRALGAHVWSEGTPPSDGGQFKGLPVRMALHTGDIVCQDGDYHGLVLHRATRILLAAHGGQILCSEATASLLRPGLPPEVRLADLGLYRLRGIEAPERLFQVNYPGIPRSEFPPLKAEAGHAGHLPLQFTRFFGREEEIRLLRERLLSARGGDGASSGAGPGRLVTLTGPGGTGKTRLALAVAAQLQEAFHGAVWFVSLAELTDPLLILDQTLSALRLPRSPGTEPLEQVVTALSCQPALLLLDNFEHLAAGGAPLVQTLLERVPTLTVLVTSRQRLNLPGEREFPVPSLPMPRGTETLEELARCDSVRLFVDRAQAVRPDFQVTERNATAVAALCERLEGIPLALELAAVRTQVLTPAQMLARLERRFDFLMGRQRHAAARHRTLRGTIDWSYELLSPELQRFFTRLSVFRGGWTLEAAEAVCGEGAPVDGTDGAEATQAGPVLEYLEQLRECSLVLAEDTSGETRFRMLETLREYGLERLTASGEGATIRRRHQQFFLVLAEQAEPKLRGLAQAEWLERLAAEHDNLRAALDWTTKKADVEAAARLMGGLGQFWNMRGYWAEGREHLAALLALPGAPGGTPVRARMLRAYPGRPRQR